MKVFLAGATGVLGRSLVPQLVARGHEVVGMTRSASKQDLVRSLGARPVMADALDSHAVAQAVAMRFLLHDCPPEIAREAFRRLRPEPGVLGKEASPLGAWPDVPSAYIVCADDRTATPAWARRAARERLGVEPIEIPGGHCPFLSRPRHLAEALERCS